MAGFAQRLLGLDRRWLFLLVFLGVATPIVMPIGLPVTTTGPTRSAYEFVEALPPGSVVMLSFDYGPSSAPENDPMAEGFLRQCFVRKLPVIVCALYPLGGLTLANNSLAKVTADYPGLRYGVDYVNLGYKDGAAAVLRSLDKDFAGPFPVDIRGTPIGRIPIMKGIHSVRDVKVVYSVATGIIGEWWVTQMHPQSGTPVIVGPTAVGAPKYYAYLNAGQMVGMVGGMKGAAEYEKLLAASHPELSQFYRSTRGFTATKGMDAQTVIHAVIILFILIGNIAYIQTKRPKKGERLMHGPVLGTWIAALLTIFALSFLYKDNPFFRFTESLFAGISLGYYIGVTLDQTFMPNLITPLIHDFGQNWDLLVPGLLGILLYMRYLPRAGWIARYALAIYVAYYIGLDFTRRLHGEVLPQLARLIVPLSHPDSHTILYSLVFAIGTLCVLIYFFFSKEQDRVTRRIARVGIYFLMISFGAAFGFTVMGRVALLIGRLNFLILDWIYPLIGIH